MKILKAQKSEDNAVKYLIELEDRQTVEALYMYDQDRTVTYHSTVCVSSQVGCAMGCRFCATGAQGFVRNLTAEEIAGQARLCDRERQAAGYPPLDAVVLAGMGEPLANFENVMAAILSIRETLGISCFELATVGIPDKIRKLADFVVSSGVKLRLNVSLHAPTDDKRLQLMPVTRRYGTGEVIDAAAGFARRTGSVARIRYMLIRGFNDEDADIAGLRALLEGKPVKLVVSAYNDNGVSGLQRPEALEVLNFYHKIKENIDSGIFRNFGASVLGGCGQLRRENACPAT